MKDDSRTTQDRALKLLLERAEQPRQSVDDPDLAAVLQDNVVRDVFETAWRHQFDSDRAPFLREVREIVESAVAEVVSGDADH